jgi:type IX secretion system PorP/SprF family membrane protein
MSSLRHHITIVLLFIATACFAQNPIQFNEYLPLLNQASVGQYQGVNGLLFGKSQWLNVPGAPRQIGSMVNLPIKENASVGININQRNLGVSSQLSLAVPIVQTFMLSEDNTISFGLCPGLDFQSSDLATVQVVDATDTEFQTNLPTLAFPNAGFSTFLNFKQSYFGLAIPKLVNHIVYYDFGFVTQNKVKINQWSYLLQAGVDFALSNDWNLELHYLGNVAPNNKTEHSLKPTIVFKELASLGLLARTDRQLGLTFNVRLVEHIKFGYGFLQTYGLSFPNVSSHEIILIFEGPPREQRKSLKPDF